MGHKEVLVTHLRTMMLEELQRRNYADTTIRHYLRFVERFAQHFGKSPYKLGPDHLRTYQVYLLKERKLSPGTVENHVAALRFFYVHTLKRPGFREFLPYPKVQRKLPNILMTDVALNTGPATCFKHACASVRPVPDQRSM
jgi:integrase/recombinase XerD